MSPKKARTSGRLASELKIGLFLYDTDSCNLYSRRREFVFFIENELPIYDRIFSFSKVTTRFFRETRGLDAAHLPFGALPIDACSPPSTYPFGTSAAAANSVTFAAYDRSTTPFVIQFWREPCPGPSARSLLWARFPCGTHDNGFAMLQDGVLGIVEYGVLFSGNCSFQPATTTFLIEQDPRNIAGRFSRNEDHIPGDLSIRPPTETPNQTLAK